MTELTKSAEQIAKEIRAGFSVGIEVGWRVAHDNMTAVLAVRHVPPIERDGPIDRSESLAHILEEWENFQRVVPDITATPSVKLNDSRIDLELHMTGTLPDGENLHFPLAMSFVVSEGAIVGYEATVDRGPREKLRQAVLAQREG